MPYAEDVNPQKWDRDSISILYDDGDYSAIWGRYEGDWCLGVRWNGEGDHIGYPSQGGNPLWYVEPEFLTESVFLSILSKLTCCSLNKRQQYIQDTLRALKEFHEQHKENCPTTNG